MMNISKRYLKVNNEGDMIEVIRAYTYLDTKSSERPKMTMLIEAPSESFTAERIKEIFSKDVSLYLYEDSYKKINNDDGSGETIHTQPLRVIYRHYFKNLNFSYSSNDNSWVIMVDKMEDSEILALSNKENTLTAFMALAELFELKISGGAAV